MKKILAELSSQIVLNEGDIVEGVLEETNEGDLIFITNNDTDYLGYLKRNPIEKSIIKSEAFSNIMKDMSIDLIEFKVSEIKPVEENTTQITYILEAISDEIIEGFFNIENNSEKRSLLVNDILNEYCGKVKTNTEELRAIIDYLITQRIDENQIRKIVNSHREYDEKYYERIPSIKDKSFSPWKWNKKGENLLQIAIVFVENGLNSRFVGGKGAGKNMLLNTLAWIYQRPLFSQAVNSETDITHLFGDKTVNVVTVNDNPVSVVEFEKGLLVEAMEVGGFYEFGEGNTSRPEVAIAMHSILDDNRKVDVNNYKLVKAHEDFRFFLTMNLNYEGCNELNKAFRDRFVTLSFPAPEDITNILKDACPNADYENISICNNVYQNVLNTSNKLGEDLITIRGYIRALKMSEFLPIRTCLECCIANTVTDDIMLSSEIKEIIDNVA